jgi:Tfp pilus assembly protein PilN
MRIRSKKVFGIDICKNAVSFVEMRKNGQQIKVLRCGSAPLDQTVVNNGVVQNPAALVKAMKQFKISGTFKHGNAALTICTEPVLLQILNLPDSSSGDTRKFVQNEVKQYAVLPLKNIEIDYCGLRSSDGQAKRVLVGATQAEHLSTIVNAIEKENVDIMAVEPAVTAFIRICYDRIIKPQREKGIILLLVRDDTLSLCVFEKQGLEFLRIKNFEADIVGSQERSNWLSHEIESVIQFHELEKRSNTQGWQIFVACCPENKYSVQIVGEIKSRILRQDVEITAFENNLMGIAIKGDDNKEIPPIAAGSAMKLLGENKTTIKLNLLPKEIVSIKKAKKQLFVIVDVAAVIFLLILIQIVVLVQRSKFVSLELNQKRQYQQNINLEQLTRAQTGINKSLRQTTESVNIIKTVFDNKIWYNWTFVLAELGKDTPMTVQIQKLWAQDSSKIQIEGLAVSYDAINDFIDRLNLCKVISSAQLTGTKQNTQYGNGLIDYSISCSLAHSKEIKKD